MSEARWWAAHAQATERFTRIPGVIGVGLGIKEVAYSLTEDVAVIVYVEAKKPRLEVNTSELIPSSIAGVKTDVQTQPQFEEFGGTTIDGGEQIRRTPDSRDRPKPGTLGYIATKTSNNENVMLSCEHVMQSVRRGDQRIFHPDVSRCCGKLKNAVGSVTAGYMGHVSFTNIHGTDGYFIDCAIASIDSGIKARKFIPGVGAISGSGDVTGAPTGSGSSTITVKKRGAATEVTEGTIDDVAFPFIQGLGAPPIQRVIKIRPKLGGTFPFSITWKVPPADVAGHLVDFPAQTVGGTISQLDADTIRFDVPVFAVPGDSGAAVVDTASGNIIGLIFSGTVYPLRAYKDGRLGTGIVPTGIAVACHLPPVLNELNIRIDPSTTPSAGRGVVVPGNEMTGELPARISAINDRLAALESQFNTSPAGRRLTGLVRDHADELVELVHHRRRVLVQWHRHQGSAFSALLLDAILDNKIALPVFVRGVSRGKLLTRMRDVLAVEGSPSLQEALIGNEEFLINLLDNSHNIDELVANLS